MEVQAGYACGRYPHSAPEKRAFRSSSGVCEPDSASPAACRAALNPRPSRRQNKNPDHKDRDFVLEVQAGFEPADNGVADRGLTTWLLHQIFDCFNIITKLSRFVKPFLCFCFLFLQNID